uniref:Uncharacterized protein n=1 Tax=Cannabis sativa TaxID=3483 RepID=A0A803QZX0_CANSA
MLPQHHHLQHHNLPCILHPRQPLLLTHIKPRHIQLHHTILHTHQLQEDIHHLRTLLPSQLPILPNRTPQHQLIHPHQPIHLPQLIHLHQLILRHQLIHRHQLIRNLYTHLRPKLLLTIHQVTSPSINYVFMAANVLLLLTVSFWSFEL